MVPPVDPISCTTVGLPGWLLGIVNVPLVIPEAGAVKETSTEHQTLLSPGSVAPSVGPQGSDGSWVTVKPLLAEIEPRVAAALPLLNTVTC